jgi:exosortase
VDRSVTKRNQFLAFGVLCALSILFWWHPLAATFSIALTNDGYTHILLILPLSMALIYMDAKHGSAKRLEREPQTRPLAGAVLLLIALLVGSYARWGVRVPSGDVRLSLAMVALVGWWIGSVVLCFGSRAFQLFLFPLCFLFWMVPLPDFAQSWIIEFLEQQSAVMARIMFRMIGISAVQEGIMIYIPNLGIEVARECSSIRSSLMLVVSTMVLAHLFLRSWWRQVLLIAASIPLSVAKNGLRIVTIGTLGTRVDPDFLNGNLHHHGGIVFFGIAVVVDVGLLWLLRRGESKMPPRLPASALR